ncbi:GntR family transcriptional regulator [Oerskovia turbata]|uniref:GntR family transcriptional regulator n=1 Tax=Oerskovia turbata TaxID=1713 RepID=A0A4Q1KT74_9CELL|nr:GntR family transcriptional regulator [Oerskovia turbata]RXR33307.1 GntR family transcriptional regulator [Oerskovia turbata]TGJ96521.1 GntR family transcriptional regulator [Actinotalea fermentans ATCC 43279 = JCM 9966 = DSM 3133]
MVQVDPRSPVPVFEQIRTQVSRLVASGQLRPGARLPAIRDLATDLDIARGTVNKAYDALARDGLVETLGRHGTIVLGPERAVARPDDVTSAADALALVAQQTGLDSEAAHAALDAALGRLRPPESSGP